MAHTIKMPTPGDTLEVDVERMSFGSAAVGRVVLAAGEKPLVVFVEGAAPCERVKARITRVRKNHVEALTETVIKPSPSRTTPPCHHFGACGGCQWQHLTYDAQLAAKTDVLIHQIARGTHIPEGNLRSRLQVHGAKSPLGYRARLQARGEGPHIGFYKAASKDLVPIDECPIARPEIRAAWHHFKRPKPPFKVEWTLLPDGSVRETLNQPHAAEGFTQVNPEQNAVLVDLVAGAARASGGERLLDLYGGDGNLTNAITADFTHIVSVEAYGPGEPASALKAPLAPGRHFVRERVEAFLDAKSMQRFAAFDVIIADPPREGLVGPIAGRIARLGAPTLILVSCDPSTLARDLAAFTADYEIKQLHLVDMFPQTFHIESVSVLALL